jgi:hypothetical protein
MKGMDDGANYSWAIISCQRIFIDRIAIQDHAGITASAGMIQGATTSDIQIGRYYCDGATAGADGLQIQDSTRLYIGSVNCNNNNGKGIFVDQDGAYTQQDIYIGHIDCTGNTDIDVVWQAGISGSSFGHMTRRSGDSYNQLAAVNYCYPFGVVCAARAEIDGGTGVATITNDYNITSITEGATGVYTVTLTTAVTDVVYVAVAEDATIEIGTHSTSAPIFVTRVSGTAARPTSFFVIGIRVDQDNL